MKANINKLVEMLKKIIGEDSFENFEVYLGEINGRYDVDYNIDRKDVLDTIYSDGEINGFSDHQDVEDAGYVCVVRYKNKEDKKEGKLEKIFLFINENSKKGLMFNMVQTDPELYQVIFDSKITKVMYLTIRVIVVVALKLYLLRN